jgi:phenylalanyl-tRNA synthetase alpha chain
MDIESLRDELERIVKDASETLTSAKSEAELHQKKAAFVGKSGSLSGMMKHMRDLEPDERPILGKAVNDARDKLQQLISEQLERIAREELQKRLATRQADATLPGRRPNRGGRHPLRVVADDMIRVFREMGYRVAVGPEVESDFHNFGALNFPPDHPAREMHDTFHVGEDHVLRTHTSSVQIRTMLANEPPIRIVAPGAVYRSDTLDATHSPYFHQLEGLFVDEGVTMAHLKGTLQAFVERFFGEKIPIRFRPSFFPFTEPSVEVDMQCSFCRGDGCRVCSQSGWIEILGAGMVDPEVFRAVGVDSDRFTGFAFGVGIERLAMRRYGVNDIRHFFENDLQFLRMLS